jgi:hypothetical protein
VLYRAVMAATDLPGELEALAGPVGPDTIAVVVANVELLERLEREFAGRVPPMILVAAVARAEDRMATARITTFVPVLVERHAREALRAFERASSEQARAVTRASFAQTV